MTVPNASLVYILGCNIKADKYYQYLYLQYFTTYVCVQYTYTAVQKFGVFIVVYVYHFLERDTFFFWYFDK